MKFLSRLLFAVAALFLLLTGCALNQPRSDQPQQLREFVFGDISVMEVIDSPLVFETGMWPDIADHPEKMTMMPGGSFETVIKTFVVKTGDRIVLIDAGVGKEHYVTQGRTLAALASVGISPGAVTDILMTHLDVDHVGGLVAGKDAVFPDAKLHLSRPEHEAWADDSGLVNRMPEHKSLVLDDVFPAYAGRLRLFDFGDTVVPGITAVDAAGHTPGHTAYEIRSGNRGMLVAGDFMHIAPIQLRAPEYSTIWDAHPWAGETRRRLLESLSDTDIMLAAMHIAEVGHVSRAQDGGYIMLPAQQP